MIKYSDYNLDNKFRKQANDLFHDLIYSLKRIRSNSKAWTKEGTLEFMLTPLLGVKVGLDIDKDFYLDVYIKKGEKKGKFYDLNISLLNNYGDKTDLVVNALTYKNSIIHELIHYLDFENKRVKPWEGRDKAKKYQTDSKEIYRDKSVKKDYFNNPLEMNAYYQDGITNLEMHLEKYGPEDDEGQNMFDYDFETFAVTAFEEFFVTGFVKALDRNNLNRLLKRLYGYYLGKREELI